MGAIRSAPAIGSAQLIAFLLILNSSACTKLPRDPENTLQLVQQHHRMRVGVAECPPWVVRTKGEPAGVEVELARQFAASLAAAPEWFWGGEQEHMTALECFELDLVLAGLDSNTTWKKKVGLTRAYFDEQILVGASAGTALPRALKGSTVAVMGGDVAAAYLRKKGARPSFVTDLSHVSGLAAAPEWRLHQLGFRLTDLRLLERKHVKAVPPGENGWLKLLEQFLQQHQSGVEPLAENTEAQP